MTDNIDAIGGLAMASGLSSQSRSPSGPIATMRKHGSIDTQLMHPTLIRASSICWAPTM